MVVIEELRFSTLWISAAIGLYIALAAFARMFLAPALRRQVALAQDGDADSDEPAGSPAVWAR